ncbi:MAG: PAS domain S-box protein [Pirellulales bacterium]|nr:PAS domain S-box protein [Pirellulales bacterium]
MSTKCDKLLTRDEYAGVLDALRQPTVVLDVSGIIVYFNEAWPAIHSTLGRRDPSHGLGRSYFDYCNAEATGQAIRAGLRNVIDGTQDSFTLAYAAGGEDDQRWFLLRARRTLIEGRILVVVRHEDISERKSTETALRTRNEWLERSIEGSSDGIWDWDLRTNELAFSSRCKKLLGYSEDEQLPKLFSTFEEHLHPDDFQHTMIAIQRHINEGVPYDIEYRLRNRQGEYRWFRVRGKVVHNDRGEPMRMAGSLQDITELKAAQIALKESEERSRSILETVVDGILTADERGVIQSVNSAILRLTGYSAEELIGKDVRMLIPERQRANHDLALKQYLDSGQPKILGIGRPVKVQHRDGTIFSAEITLGEFESGSRRIFTGVLRKTQAPVPSAPLAPIDTHGMANISSFANHG